MEAKLTWMRKDPLVPKVRRKYRGPFKRSIPGRVGTGRGRRSTANWTLR